MSVVTETQLANRALQKVGAELISAGAFRTEDSKNANELRAAYDSVRRSELRRNVWRFAIRTVALRALDFDSKLVTFAAWDSITSFALNDIVMGTDGQLYSSLSSANVGNDPTTSFTAWELYFGNLIAQEYVTTWANTITFAKGDHTIGSDGLLYTALNNGITANPVGDGNVHWSLSTTVDPDDPTEATDTSFFAGELVYIGNKVWISLVSQNEDAPEPVSVKWLQFTSVPSVAKPNFIYPIGSGPRVQTSTRNAYRLPNGFLREAPQDPKAGATNFLGAPSGLPYSDWNFESDYFTTRDSGVIAFRCVVDIVDPTKFDPLFFEGFAARLGYETCTTVTNSSAKKKDCLQDYMKFMTEARLVNGIETGATQPPEDDYISCRQ